MSRALSTLLAVLFLLASAIPVAAGDPEPPKTPDSAEVVPGEVVVKWHDADRGPAVARARGLAIVAELGVPGKGMPSLLSTEGRGTDEVLAELRADPAVAYAEPNYVVRLVEDPSVAAVPVNDPKTAGQYSLDRMMVRDAWSLDKGGSGVVAVLDTGVQANHRDLSGRVLPGYDFVNNDTNAADDNGHGTWVAGIIASKPNDGYGIAGVSWSDKILPVKVMSRTGTGDTADLTAGIIWAANHGATVINMSVGGFPAAQYVQDAVNYAWGKGVVLVGAAGNNNREETFYPASFTNVVSVSATQINDEFSHWSSYGPKVDVSAPGSSVQTTNCTVCTYADHHTWGDHTYISGTSFATPNVAGVIALIRARYPSYTPAQVVSRLITTADDLGRPGYENRYGNGRVNAFRALGGSPAAPPASRGDALEPNQTLQTARTIALGTTRPSLHPAGDVDVFAVQVPRAGRLDVRVGGVVDTRVYPWNGSGLPIDPIVELYSGAGVLLKRVDLEWESGTELASVTVSGPSRILVRIVNYYANGSRSAYAVTPSFVDTVAPKLVGRSPAPSAVSVRYDGALVTADFDEAVVGVGPGTVGLKDASGAPVAATLGIASSGRRVTLQPAMPLAPEAVYRVVLTSGLKDAAGNAVAATSWTFTTGKSAPRIAGADRYATAAAISRFAFSPGVPVVYVADGTTYQNALAGGPAARVGNGPLLLTAPSFLPAATAAELARLNPGRIVLVGSTGTVSSSVENTLRGYTAGGVTRIAGSDAYATAAAISASAFPSGASVVHIATGSNFPDALAAGAAAARVSGPILMVGSTTLPAVTAAELDRLNPAQIIVMGGPSIVSDAVLQQMTAYAGTVRRVAGADRYATAVSLSASTFAANSVGTVYVASGTSFPDGLAAAPVAGRKGSPLLLVPSNSLPASVAAELRRLDPSRVIIIGGTGVVSDAVRAQILALWP
ncbi:MAG TPA: S8 family serine peptidase [Candidatus Limnocylindrales bacterium]|nr:S8 family serine peptidase [Candidatus Limnocylindrales bacterium]